MPPAHRGMPCCQSPSGCASHSVKGHYARFRHRLGDAAKRPQGLEPGLKQVAVMAGDNAVVIKRIKKGGHGGHHGGAWKVAYADFVTAMMAFFLLMWLINTTTPEQKRGIAMFFQTPLAVALNNGSGAGDSSSVIQGGGTDLTRQAGQV